MLHAPEIIMNDRTELRVVDVMRSLERGTQIVVVQILQGDPKIGMELKNPKNLGRWKINGFGMSPCESSLGSTPLMILSLLPVEEASELSELPEGSCLVESR
jgi:hypothetical protein